ncbi:MAG: flavodoxin-dependent (E)-4-hydroxy-3-methylbut-2-enyl-diphosphate synthase [Bacillota bacterium]|nr:flavodoxin-dependent (E)-4-hydroxy-3-methylbut-2-enyl-diphosphate synthase [Bacillota bacterium]
MELYPRKKTRSLRIGRLKIGGGAPIAIQSMNNTRTQDVPASLAQLRQLYEAGCGIGRLAVPDQMAAQALAEIVKQSPMPLVADIHFDYRLALAAVKAGISALRINPGNIGDADRVRQVALAARAAGIPIRIGVNGGSLDKRILARCGGITAEGLCESALEQAEQLERCGFYDIKISLKCTELPVMLAAYRRMAEISDYPLHIGVTEAGTLARGSLKNAIGIGALLSEGIGDTLRVSLTADPVEEVRVAKDILQMLGLEQSGWEFVSCPTCGRTCIDLIGLAQRVEKELSAISPRRRRKVAVMGCAVNGPGEASDADLGLAGGADGGLIFCHGQKLGFFPEAELLPEFLRLARALAEEE